MADIAQFKLPDIGEGLTEADILSWRVRVGDVVEVNQILVEVETAKAAVELPSPYAGTVTALHVQEGQTVDVGTPIISIDTAPAGTPASVDADPAAAAAAGLAAEQAGPRREPVLVGYGPRVEGTARRRRRSQAPAPSVQGAFNVPPVGAEPTSAAAPSTEPPGIEPPGTEPPPDTQPTETQPGGTRAPSAPAAHRVLAKPPVRKLAKTLGVDLGSVQPTGPNGSVSREDVALAAGNHDGPLAAAPSLASGALPGGETRIAVRGVRKHTAAAMVASAFTAPHVTEFVTIDVTATMQLRERVAASPRFRGVKVSPLLFVARAVMAAIGRTPEINASWDGPAGEIVLKHYVNLGIAAATDRGLVVPSIKGADRLTLLELAQAITALTETARAGRATPADLTGGTITITNVGVFGVDTGTPILNPGETGIVAFGAVRRMPWVCTGPDGAESIEPRWVTQLAVSFDHRVVDGQQGSQFLSDVAAFLTDPALALIQGA